MDEEVDPTTVEITGYGRLVLPPLDFSELAERIKESQRAQPSGEQEQET